jgi:hypothetical protein
VKRLRRHRQPVADALGKIVFERHSLSLDLHNRIMSTLTIKQATDFEGGSQSKRFQSVQMMTIPRMLSIRLHAVNIMTSILGRVDRACFRSLSLKDVVMYGLTTKIVEIGTIVALSGT